MKRVLTFGVFDYFHLGHLRLIKQCKMHGEYVIVGVQKTEFIRKYKPFAELLYSTDERVEIIESLREVDKVITYDELNVKLLDGIDFDVLALGEDHVGTRFDELIEYCDRMGKSVVRLKRTEGISSSEIKQALK